MNSIQKCLQEQRQMLDKCTREGKDDLNPLELKRYNELSAEIDRLMAAEKTANKLTREANRGPVATQGNYRITDGWGDGTKSGGKPMKYEKSDYKFNYDGDDVRDDFWKAVLFNDTAAYFQRSGELIKDSDVKGGFLVPVVTYNEIIREAKNDVFMLNHARIFDCQKGESIEVPVLGTEMSDPTFRGEIAETSWDTEMAFQKRTLTPHRAMIGVKVSKRLVETNAVNAVRFIEDEINYQFQSTLENELLNGTGQGSTPLGLFTTDDSGVTSVRDESGGNTTSAIKADNIINTLYKLRAPYLRSGSCYWILHRNTLKMIRKLKTGEGQYIWQPGLADNQKASILDFGYHISEFAPNIDTASSGDRVMAIGDLRYYGVATGGAMTIQVLHEKYAHQGMIAILGTFWVDGMVLCEDAFAMSTLA